MLLHSTPTSQAASQGGTSFCSPAKMIASTTPASRALASHGAPRTTIADAHKHGGRPRLSRFGQRDHEFQVVFLRAERSQYAEEIDVRSQAEAGAALRPLRGAGRKVRHVDAVANQGCPARPDAARLPDLLLVGAYVDE